MAEYKQGQEEEVEKDDVRRQNVVTEAQLNTGQGEIQAAQQLDYRLQQSTTNLEPRGNDEEVVQVVYQSDQHGSLVGVESTSLLNSTSAPVNSQQHFDAPLQSSLDTVTSIDGVVSTTIDGFSAPHIVSGHQQLSRAGSTLPPVAEESISSVPSVLGEPNHGNGYAGFAQDGIVPGQNTDLGTSMKYIDIDRDATSSPIDAYSAPMSSANLNECTPEFSNSSNVHDDGGHHEQQLPSGHLDHQRDGDGRDEANFQEAPIYSTVNKQHQASISGQGALNHALQEENSNFNVTNSSSNNNNGTQLVEDAINGGRAVLEGGGDLGGPPGVDSFGGGGGELIDYGNSDSGGEQRQDDLDEAGRAKEEIGQIVIRQRAGPVEKGSFRNNFRKKLGLSVSTNENDLIAHRQKFIESVQDDDKSPASAIDDHRLQQQAGRSLAPGGLGVASHGAEVGQKFKRTHSVSFNVHSSRSNRHSVDIRNLPSYLTHKRTSIVDVARGAMSSLISSFGGGSGSGSVISGSHRRDSIMGYNDKDELDNEPIFEEPIAPTLSLGQRVAMVGNSGTEFGTVGWIGQLPDIDDDWIVGVIFDNMIGDCDGAYKGVRYFYARNHYAMFVPLSVLTKTDNYIGRPETGTVLSRMSVSLKPGQLISIQRSSIRLQHCFLNAPHQRVGHDVRAVSNRLHCQCHNCGPCAHLTKQGRPNVLPHFGAIHLPHRKKNSLAHAAVEMLAHHHHHFHEEEEHDEKDYEFGDNAAHACNFVRYSCCQQRGSPGHEFSSDCGMVRPELLDNLIHAPRAPHRRSRPRRTRQQRQQQHRAIRRQDLQQQQAISNPTNLLAIERDDSAKTAANSANTNTLETNKSSVTATGTTQTNTSTMQSSVLESSDMGAEVGYNDDRGSHSSYSLSASSSAVSSSSSSSSSSPTLSRSPSLNGPRQLPYNYYQYDTSSFRPQNNVFQTVSSQVSIVDQQRFVYRRDSSALMQSTKQQSNLSDDGESVGTGGFGRRMLRCFGCLKRRTGSRRRPRRKLSFKDRVLEYRRRQSTFVPSTLAKPHEDFATHSRVMSSIDQTGGAAGEANSDYSSCSKSSCSSRSQSPSSHYRSNQDYATTSAFGDSSTANNNTDNVNPYQQQHTTMTMEYDVYPATNDQLKSAQGRMNYTRGGIGAQDDDYKRQLNYGDFNFSDSYDSCKMKNEVSKDSALTDFAYSDTYKTNSSSDTLKFLVDQSINEQVVLPQPMYENDILSTISSNEQRVDSATSDQIDISSPTVSAIDHDVDEENEEQLSRGVENIALAPRQDPQV